MMSFLTSVHNYAKKNPITSAAQTLTALGSAELFFHCARPAGNGNSSHLPVAVATLLCATNYIPGTALTIACAIMVFGSTRNCCEPQLFKLSHPVQQLSGLPLTIAYKTLQKAFGDMDTYWILPASILTGFGVRFAYQKWNKEDYKSN